MAVPTTREQLKDYCLRRLGQGVVKINISEDQAQDRIDDAIKYWRDYHQDATEKVFIQHPLTAADITNKYITIEENILEVTKIISPGSSYGGSVFNNVKYQYMRQEVWNLSKGGTLVPYYVAMRHINMIDDLLGAGITYRFNRHSDRCYIDTNWDTLAAGEYLVLEGYAILDDTITELWGDRFLQRYATALMKQQWGGNMKKFNEVQLLNGVTFNGKEIYDEATEELIRLEEDMIDKFSLPPLGFIA